MKNFAGKIAFITGGASGAGLGQAKVFGKAGMRVAIADIRQDALDKAVEELVAYGLKREDVLALKVDLTDRKEYAAAADKVEEVFGGPPHLLIQTAGVNSFGPAEASTFDDYDWVMGVCLHAVVASSFRAADGEGIRPQENSTWRPPPRWAPSCRPTTAPYSKPP